MILFIYNVSRSLTEKLVAVLIKMKCPHRIEPHQIQGLDFIHIFPIIQVMRMLKYYSSYFMGFF